MFKYTMTINNEPYIALFVNYNEADNFINEVKNDGDSIAIEAIQSITAMEILNNQPKGLEWSYCVEMAYIELFPNDNAVRTMKVWELEKQLKRYGYID